MTVLLGIALMLAAPPEPSYLVERIVSVGTETRRVTLFRDGVGVVVRRDAGGSEDLRHVEVGGLVLGQMEQVVREVYPGMVQFVAMSQGTGAGSVELRLAPHGQAPLVLRLAVEAAPSAATARLIAHLDALEERILSGKPPAEDLRAWEPRSGELVELDDGRVVTILDVIGTTDGVWGVRFRVGDSPASEILEMEDMRRRAVRLLPEEGK